MGIHIFDDDVQKANIWIKELMIELDLNESTAFHALKGTLQEIRDRLPVEEATHFAAQLPILIKGLFYEGWKPGSKPIKYNRSEFVSRIHSHLNNDPDFVPDEITVKILAFLKRKMPSGEIEDIKNNWPKEMAHLWD